MSCSYVIKMTGEIEDIFPTNGKDFSLEELQRIVKGYIEIVYLNGGYIMVVNEEGKILQMPLNYDATICAILHGGIGENDWIAGDALICRSDMVK